MHFDTLDYVILVVDDLDRSRHFYEDVLGLPLRHRAEEYAQFDTGTTRLGLYTRTAMSDTLDMPVQSPSQDAPGFEIGFKVDDVDATYDDLVNRSATPFIEPTDRPWGQRTAYVRDPDGHLIELAQDLEP